jgi:hypothetical protein
VTADAHEEGPRFAIRTWRRDGGWHATATIVDPIAAPFPDERLWTTDNDEAGADRPELAVRRAVARLLELHGERCYCESCDTSGPGLRPSAGARCLGRCICGGHRRIVR